MENLPFDGDTFIPLEFLKLKEKFDIKIAVETGSYLGNTTHWLGENFERVYSIENNKEYYDITSNYCSDLKNVELLLGNSQNILGALIGKIKNERCVFFLDAHWGNVCPTPFELSEIKRMEIPPIIIIHDFYVPGKSHPEGMHNQGHPGWGWDYYPGFKYNWESVENYINDIYGENNYHYYYNEEVNGARRGVVYIHPKL